jgi:hypothetical protein
VAKREIVPLLDELSKPVATARLDLPAHAMHPCDDHGPLLPRHREALRTANRIRSLLIFLWLKGLVPFLQIASYLLVDGIEGRAQLRMSTNPMRASASP